MPSCYSEIKKERKKKVMKGERSKDRRKKERKKERKKDFEKREKKEKIKERKNENGNTMLCEKASISLTRFRIFCFFFPRSISSSLFNLKQDQF